MGFLWRVVVEDIGEQHQMAALRGASRLLDYRADSSTVDALELEHRLLAYLLDSIWGYDLKHNGFVGTHTNGSLRTMYTNLDSHDYTFHDI